MLVFKSLLVIYVTVRYDLIHSCIFPSRDRKLIWNPFVLRVCCSAQVVLNSVTLQFTWAAVCVANEPRTFQSLTLMQCIICNTRYCGNWKAHMPLLPTCNFEQMPNASFSRERCLLTFVCSRRMRDCDFVCGPCNSTCVVKTSCALLRC